MYAQTTGVCPDIGRCPTDPTTCNNVRLIASDIRNGVATITFLRPIKVG